MTDQSKSARAALAVAIKQREEARAAVSRVREAHAMAKAILDDASGAVSALKERDNARSARAASDLANAIRSGAAPVLVADDSENAERAAAERHAAVALGACNALADDLSDAQQAATAAQTEVQTAAKAVMIAMRDELTSELQAKTREFLDVQHRLMGLLDSTLVPSTAAAASATQEVYRAYPPSLHPAPFAGRAWRALSTALLDNPEAVFVPITPSVPKEVLTPEMQRAREQWQAHQAEREANAEKLEAETKAYTQADLMAERYGRILNGDTHA